MKSIFTLTALFFFICSFAQKADTSIPPYKRFPTLPSLQLVLGDGTTKYTKADIPGRKPVLIMLFSPECSHCQHTAEEMMQYKEELKNIHIVMATMHSVPQMNEFAQKYKLNQMGNVVIGKDAYYILAPFYGIKNLPYMAMYNQKGNLILGFEGSMPIKKVLETFKANK